MPRIVLMAVLVLGAGCRHDSGLAPYLGSYYGGFDTALTLGPGDDLNPNECAPGEPVELCRRGHGNPLSHLLIKLAVNVDHQLTLAFYRTQEDFEAGRSMYLSEGCRTTLAPAQAYELHAFDESLDETQVVLTASFPLEFGRQILACTNSARLGAGHKPVMELSLQVNPVTGARAVSLILEKSRRDGDYLYVKKSGGKVPVKLDLGYLGTDAVEARRLCAVDGETKIENKDGINAVCVMTGRKKWSVVLPLSPVGPGVTVFWGSTRSPKWYRSSGEPDIVTYHRGVFLPVSFEAFETSGGAGDTP